jgi:4-carboxymuconolactone decarboxylase
MTDWTAGYRNMFGAVPPFVQSRQAEQAHLHPEFLDALETMRMAAFDNPALDDATKQLIAFAVLISHVRPAAVNHAVGARRAGATEAQVHAAAEIATVLGALGPGNRIGDLLADMRKQLDGGGA